MTNGTGPELKSASFIVSAAQIGFDTAMLSYDVWGTTAHVLMLHHTGIITAKAARAICDALTKLGEEVAAGTFTIDPSRGAQLSLERAVVAAVGVEDGSRMHTARSRNDQVLVTEMLYLRERTLTIAGEAHNLL